MTVYFQGWKGAYSEEAAQKYFGKGIASIGLPKFADVFNKAKNSHAYGTIPIENSTSGSIYENYDLLLKSNVKVCGEQYFRVKHNLVAPERSKIADIKTVYSHIQALLQCKKFLGKKRFKCCAVDDTANAARMVGKRNRKEEAAIASQRAACIYGLKILRRSIEDNSSNITRFLVISKKAEPQSYNKISLAFGCAHRPGSLVNCLKPFKKYGLNITKVESRPIPDRQWEYVFYIDATGSFRNQNNALAALKNNTNFIKVLGQYKAGKSPV